AIHPASGRAGSESGRILGDLDRGPYGSMCTSREMMAVEMRVVGRLFVDGTRRWVLTVVGFALLAVGIAGLVLPILPGWALIIAGFVVLSREYSWANSALAFARRQAARGGRGLRDRLRGLRRRGRPAEVDLPLAVRPDAQVVLPGDGVLIDLTQDALRPPRQPQPEPERTA